MDGDDARELDFIPRYICFFHILNDLWTGDGTKSSPSGVDYIFYDHQSIIDRPIGEVGNYFHAVRMRYQPW